MNTEEHGPNHSADRLKREFDESFARPIRVTEDAVNRLLCIRIAGDSYALQLGEVAGLLVDKEVVSIPGERLGFKGVIGFRGEIVPVYALKTMLEYSDDAPARWTVVARAASVVAFEFDDYQGLIVVNEADVVAADGNAPRHQYVHAVARTNGTLRPVLSVALLVKALERASAGSIEAKEDR